MHISMVWRQTALTPLLTHWSYCNLALSHRHVTVYHYNLTICICLESFYITKNRVYEKYLRLPFFVHTVYHVVPMNIILENYR